MLIDYEHELNAEQYEAVKTTEGPVLILAVAGAGKTRTLVYRVAYLIEKGVSPDSILLLTFTNKAAAEMKERASKMLDDRCSRIEACTYHSFCVKMLRAFGIRIGVAPDFEILSGSDQSDAVSIVKAALGYDYRGFPKSSVIAGIISTSINLDIPIRELFQKEKYEEYEPWTDNIIQIAEHYQKYKKDHNMLDFDDMLVKYLRLLRECPDLRKRIDARYNYIMVDEYQDSNHLQDQILMEMRRDNRNLAVVGDDMQSLYGFRGADVGNIIRFPEKYPGCRVITLFRNYRSNQEILDTANAVVKRHATQGIFKPMEGTYSAGYRPIVVDVHDQYTESAYIRNAISTLMSSGFNGRPVKLSDIAILERNSYSSNSLEVNLTKYGIPYVKYGGMKFMDRSYVKDIIAFWKVLVNDRDEIAWYRILQLFPGIAKKYSQQISAGAGESGRNILITHPFRTHKFAGKLREFRDTYDKWKSTMFPDILDTTIKYYKSLSEDNIKNIKGKTKPETDALLRQLDDNIKTLSVFTDMSGQYKDLSAFVDNITLEPPEESDKGVDHLTISTIHSAKGLEFPIVFILDCADGIFPKHSEEGTDEDNEELRCMYVAMTRAKDALYMIQPDNGSSFGKPVLYKQSHFLRGAEDTYTERYYETGDRLRQSYAG